MEAGKTALGQLTAGTAEGGQFAKPFTMADAKNAPAMQEAQRAGTDVIQNSASSKGGLIGTNTNEGLVKFGQANAAQFENQAFNQWLQERNAMLQPLESLAQIGSTTTTNVADNIGNLTLAGGNAGAAGTIGSANAMSGALGNIGQQFSMIQGLFNPTPTTGAMRPVDYGLGGGGGMQTTPGGGVGSGLMPPVYSPPPGP